MLRSLALASALVLVGSLAHGQVPEGAVRMGELYVEDNETLGTPYRAYWLSEPALHKFLASDDLDPTGYATLNYFGFPIVGSTGRARSVLIKEIRGRYMYVGGLKANTVDTRMVELGKSGKTAFLFKGNWFGSYIFTRSKSGELEISPVTSLSAEYLSMEPGEVGAYPFVKFDSVAAKLKKAVQHSIDINPIPPDDASQHDH